MKIKLGPWGSLIKNIAKFAGTVLAFIPGCQAAAGICGGIVAGLELLGENDKKDNNNNNNV